MKIKLYRSSTVGLNLSGYKILMDPWLTDGEYYGSWSHYPYYDLDKNINNCAPTVPPTKVLTFKKKFFFCVKLFTYQSSLFSYILHNSFSFNLYKLLV